MTCLDDDTVLGLIEGRLAAPVLAVVDDHLDACASCRDVVSQLARTRGDADVLERGRAIGRYVIGDLLGTGAMGRVYSAWQPELDRRVAIKMMRDSADARDRLRREAQAMARLNHPNIVTVHEVGETDDGVYVAMELVDGETLRAWAARPRGWREAAGVLADVARGLAAVHAAGVIHRDVKPENVIVGADDRVRLGDFGLARSPAAAGVSLAAGSIDRPLDSASAVVGTPAYMAPEVLRGASADAASDQFSFGVTAYEVLAGKRPFAGRTWAELAASIDAGIGPGVPGPRWLDATIRRCLARDAGDRSPSMQAVADQLARGLSRRRPARWLAGAAAAAAIASGVTYIALRGSQAAASCAIGDAELAPVWNQQLRGALAASWKASADAPAALAAIDAWTTAWTAERESTCRAAAAEPPPKLAARERCLDQRRAELAAVLARSTDPDRVDRVIDALAALPAPAECRVVDLGRDPMPADRDRAAIVGEVSAALPELRAAIALGDARPVVARATAIVDRARAGGHAPTLADALLVQTDALRGADRFADAAIAARDAVAAAERGHDDLAAARAWIARVALADELRGVASADDLGAIAAAAIDRAGAPDRLVALLLRLRGTIAYDRGELADARRFLADARTRFALLRAPAEPGLSIDTPQRFALLRAPAEPGLSIDTPQRDRSLDVAAVDSLLGSVARAAGDLDEAERRHRAALDVDRALRGPHHPDVARDLHNLAGVLRLRGSLDAAAATYREALAIEVATRGERSAEAGLTHNSLGLVLMARRDWPAAHTELTLARDALDAAGHGDRAFAEHNLGLVAAAQGDHREALARFTRAGEIYASTIGDRAAPSIRLGLDRARSELALGHRDVARDLATRARDAARVAEIGWIADDATAFLSAAREAAPAVAVEPPQRKPPTGTLGDAAPVSPVPPIQPKRDVGVYGASQP